MGEIKVYADKELRLNEALDIITEKWVLSGESSNQTTIDLANACRILQSQLTQERQKRKRDLEEVLNYFENNNDEQFRHHIESKLKQISEEDNE